MYTWLFNSRLHALCLHRPPRSLRHHVKRRSPQAVPAAAALSHNCWRQLALQADRHCVKQMQLIGPPTEVSCPPSATPRKGRPAGWWGMLLCYVQVCCATPWLCRGERAPATALPRSPARSDAASAPAASAGTCLAYTRTAMSATPACSIQAIWPAAEA